MFPGTKVRKNRVFPHTAPQSDGIVYDFHTIFGPTVHGPIRGKGILLIFATSTRHATTCHTLYNIDQVMKSYFVFLSRNKLYAAIQLSGLAVTMGFIILLISFARTEFSVGRNQSLSDEIYVAGSGDDISLPVNTPSLLFSGMPGIRDWVRIGQAGSMDIRHGDGRLMVRTLAVDTAFFKFFDYELRGTDRRRVMAAADEVIVSESFARKMFPGKDPVGQTLTDAGGQTFTVVGVTEDFDADDLFPHVDMLTSMMAEEQRFGHGNFRFTIFVRLANGVAPEDARQSFLEQAMKQWDCWQSEKGEGYTFLWGASMTPLKDIYFSSIQGGAVRHGNRDMVVALGLMALVLLVSAVFNYINLTMAQVGKRAKETATRRLLGDTIPMVVGRHFAEALIFVLGSFACAGILALVLRPWFEGLVDTRVYFFVDVWTVLGTAMLTFSIAFVAGLLPAMIASRFKPIDVMKGSFRFYNRKWLSRVFIVLQNCISTTLIAIGLTMALQMHHLDTLPMGYDTEGIVEIRTFDLYKRLDELQPLVNALKALPEVKDVGNAATLPYSCEYNGVHIPDGSGEATQTSWISQSRMDSTSFKMLGFKVIEQYCVPEEDYLWISEETRNRYGVSADRPYFGGQAGNDHRVCGVIKDYRSCDAMKKPMDDSHGVVQVFNSGNFSVSLLVELHRLDKAKADETLAKIKSICGKASVELCGVDKNLRVRRLADALAEPLEKQHNITTLVLCFMGISVLISALGMLGMSISYAEQNSKQIALRRVMGATLGNAVWELARPFLLLSLLAALIALPFAIMAIQRYLEDFYNRIDFPWWMVAMSVVASLLISFVSVVWHSFTVANRNPVESIRTE